MARRREGFRLLARERPRHVAPSPVVLVELEERALGRVRPCSSACPRSSMISRISGAVRDRIRRAVAGRAERRQVRPGPLGRRRGRADQLVDAGAVEDPGDDRPGLVGQRGKAHELAVAADRHDLAGVSPGCGFAGRASELEQRQHLGPAARGAVERRRSGRRRRRGREELVRPALADQVFLLLTLLEEVLDVVDRDADAERERRRAGRSRRAGCGTASLVFVIPVYRGCSRSRPSRRHAAAPCLRGAGPVPPSERSFISTGSRQRAPRWIWKGTFAS